MSEWNEETESFVDAFREDLASDLDVDAAWDRFAVESMGEQPVGGGRRVLWWVAGVAGVAAALAVLWSVQPATWVGEAEPGSAGQHAVDDAVRRDTGATPLPGEGRSTARAQTSASLSDATPREPDAQATQREPETEADTDDTPTRGRRSGRPPGNRSGGTEVEDPAAEPAGASRLAEELKLLEAMRSAHAAGRHADALSSVRAHAKTYGKGPFAAERELTRVRALCALGRTQDALAAQKRFARSFPDSHLGTLVRSACGDADEKELKSDHEP
ncbi:MAG: tetratricopeptide repeat protein [Nannocystaceae bacterium]|nr:hypothetical protein [bacterium]